MREYDPPNSGSYLICCPYCGSVFSASFTKTFEEVTCPECVKNEEWHKGVFLGMLSTMSSITRKGPFRLGYSLRWCFRVITIEGIKVVECLTGTLLPIGWVSASDFVTFSYPKSSKGRRKKYWDGSWKSEPTAIANNESKKGWFTRKVSTGDGYIYVTTEGKRLAS